MLIISLITRRRLYSSCVRSSMLYGSETWPVRNENEVALQQAQMRMVRWMCGIKVSNNARLTCDQKLVKASLIYHTEPKQNRIYKIEFEVKG